VTSGGTATSAYRDEQRKWGDMSEATPEILDGSSGDGHYNAFEGMDTPRIRHITG
jgi:hypothetical protein